MTVDPQRYKRGGRRQKRHHRKQINVRLQRAKFLGGPPTRSEVITAMQFVLDHGKVPRGWRLAVMDWQTPGSGRGPISGTIDDMETFRPIIEAALHDARIALVGGEDVD